MLFAEIVVDIGFVHTVQRSMVQVHRKVGKKFRVAIFYLVNPDIQAVSVQVAADP